MPLVLPLAMPPAVASPEVVREDTHEGGGAEASSASKRSSLCRVQVIRILLENLVHSHPRKRL